jgi:hypothetical protein
MIENFPGAAAGSYRSFQSLAGACCVLEIRRTAPEKVPDRFAPIILKNPPKIPELVTIS